MNINPNILSFISRPECPFCKSPLLEISRSYISDEHPNLVCEQSHHKKSNHTFGIYEGGSYLSSHWWNEDQKFSVWMSFNIESLGFTIINNGTIIKHVSFINFSEYNFLSFNDLRDRLELYLLLS